MLSSSLLLSDLHLCEFVFSNDNTMLRNLSRMPNKWWNQDYSISTLKVLGRENQGGGIGRHTVPPRITRTDRKSNRKEV